MGVPTFYRWLCTKWPKVVKDVIEERQIYDAGRDSFVPADLSAPNPNGIEFDNLYVDMNGVVHPCCHPEDTKQPESEAEMFLNLCDYLDRIVNIVRPRKLIYLALDGVAPRAKMNQQRSRRFKSAAEAEAAEEAYEELRAEWATEGREIPSATKKWDTNVITPGTSFMHRLAGVLRYYVSRRMRESSYWRSLRVLLSDSNVPGEGEHKVMSYIRQQRLQEGYDPNTKHCMHGMDADLIMLGLSTHEAHFYVVREVVTDKRGDTKCLNCGIPGHSFSECRRPARSDLNSRIEALSSKPSEVTKAPEFVNEVSAADALATHKSFRASWQPLQFLQLPVLREYLALEYRWTPQELVYQDPNSGQISVVGTDLERHIDDFILLCFFVGNDFLPHLPSFSIQKGSIDQLMLLYKTIYPNLGGYLTDAGHLNMGPLRYLAQFLAQVEPEVLKFDHQRKQRMKNQREEREQGDQKRRRVGDPSSASDTHHIAPSSSSHPSVNGRFSHTPSSVSNASGRRNSRALSEASDDSSSVSVMSPPPPGATKLIESALSQSHREAVDMFREKLKLKMKDRSEVDDAKDDVVLGSGNPEEYRRKYYKVKFALAPEDDVEECAERVSRHFVRGLEWVLLYYFQGVPTWEWFYPFHYAPLAVDIFRYGLTPDNTGNSFAHVPLGQPLTPLEQLMANLPPRSANNLPPCLGQLMTSSDSPLRDFYPTKFHEDPDGKRFRWQWVALVPFIDVERLKLEARKRFDQLEPNEVERNTEGSDLLFLAPDIGPAERLLSDTLSLVSSKGTTKVLKTPQIGLTLEIKRPPPNFSLRKGRPVLVDCDGFPEIPQICTVAPVNHPKPLKHRCQQLPGAQPPLRTLTVEDEIDDGDKGGGNRFNSKVAKRMIMQVIGGAHYEAFREREEQERESRRSYNPSHIPYNNPLVRNLPIPPRPPHHR
eukprot:Blabericola_migrator_1__4596@NODE_243_length_10934_cov_182_833625_g205_i0_p1_GENE_NODE_243_length_10934_cov_182_833625_g205_i0NODE_243_length_10934_cov_182_833625_g205_i0_p1_ORF_typecomplete_len937_score166_50XRN_N/PF03159_18/1_3e95XRN_N/PF03159_18/18XRN_M/PF17846_1/3_4e92SPASM/PF13186_6/0_5zfCCHC_4/PF14392_6/0_76_NODE_243_length_10934_cov_182_833625_g205_i067789588